MWKILIISLYHRIKESRQSGKRFREWCKIFDCRRWLLGQKPWNNGSVKTDQWPNRWKRWWITTTYGLFLTGRIYLLCCPFCTVFREINRQKNKHTDTESWTNTIAVTFITAHYFWQTNSLATGNTGTTVTPKTDCANVQINWHKCTFSEKLRVFSLHTAQWTYNKPLSTLKNNLYYS